MEELRRKVKTGALNVVLTNEDDAEIGRFSFNPVDLNIIRRYEEVVANLEKMEVPEDATEKDILELSDFIGSTSQIIDYATKSENNTFIICTEMGVFYELHQKNPEKKFYSVGHRQFCPNMKMVRLEGVKEALETMQPEVNLGEEMRQKAALPLEKMLKLAAQ